jgi:hypothetical protein
MALHSNIPATNNGSTLTLSVDGDWLVANCNGFTYKYDLNEIRSALAGVAQQHRTGAACGGAHNLVVTSECGDGDLSLCGNAPNTVVCHVHGVRYDFPIEACRSAIAVANTQAKINA